MANPRRPINGGPYPEQLTSARSAQYLNCFAHYCIDVPDTLMAEWQNRE